MTGAAHIRGKKIGLLGGSFNPAHEGHVHLSLEAIKRLKLDAVWWLVSPQNPLKAKGTLADYDKRFAYAKTLTQAVPFIYVSDFEQQHHLFYTISTLRLLKKKYPRTSFVWLMGADNLEQFHRWEAWQEIFALMPLAIFDRAPFSHAALHAPAAQHFAHARRLEREGFLLPKQPTPAWIYCFMKRHPLSATHLRKTLGENAFILHN